MDLDSICSLLLFSDQGANLPAERCNKRVGPDLLPNEGDPVRAFELFLDFELLFGLIGHGER